MTRTIFVKLEDKLILLEEFGSDDHPASNRPCRQHSNIITERWEVEPGVVRKSSVDFSNGDLHIPLKFNDRSHISPPCWAASSILESSMRLETRGSRIHC